MIHRRPFAIALVALLAAPVMPVFAQESEWITAPGAQKPPAPQPAPPAPGPWSSTTPQGTPTGPAPYGMPQPPATVQARTLVEVSNQTAMRVSLRINGAGPDLLPGQVLGNQVPVHPDALISVTSEDGRAAEQKLGLDSQHRYLVLVGDAGVTFQRTPLMGGPPTPMFTPWRVGAASTAGSLGLEDPFHGLVFDLRAGSGTIAFPTAQTAPGAGFSLGLTLLNGIADTEDDVSDDMGAGKRLRAPPFSAKGEVGYTRIDLNASWTVTPDQLTFLSDKMQIGALFPIMLESQEAKLFGAKKSKSITGIGNLTGTISTPVHHREKLGLSLLGTLVLPTADGDFAVERKRFAIEPGLGLGYAASDKVTVDGIFALPIGSGGLDVRLGGGLRIQVNRELRVFSSYDLVFTGDNDVKGTEGTFTLGLSYLVSGNFAFSAALRVHAPKFDNLQRKPNLAVGFGYAFGRPGS